MIEVNDAGPRQEDRAVQNSLPVSSLSVKHTSTDHSTQQHSQHQPASASRSTVRKIPLLRVPFEDLSSFPKAAGMRQRWLMGDRHGQGLWNEN